MLGVDNRIPSVDGTAPPPGDYTCWDDYMRDVEQLERERYDAHLSRRITKAMRLAPTALVFCALLEGQPVPHDAMDQEWLRRYA